MTVLTFNRVTDEVTADGWRQIHNEPGSESIEVKRPRCGPSRQRHSGVLHRSTCTGRGSGDGHRPKRPAFGDEDSGLSTEFTR